VLPTGTDPYQGFVPFYLDSHLLDVHALHCRRCQSQRLIPLEKKQQNDNDVFRCQECVYIFSPATTLKVGTGEDTKTRTTAVQSSYLAQS
jgi:hypothetical protein